MATTATLAALAKLTGMRDGVLARTARADFAGDPERFKEFSVTLDDLLFDYSKQRIDAGVMAGLVELAKAAAVEAERDAMFAGEKINITEKRAVLHTALRNFSGKPVRVDGQDVMPEVIGTREKMLGFAADVREGRVRGRPRPADDRRHQYRHRRVRPRPRHGDARACRLSRRHNCAATSSPTSMAPTSATPCAGSIRRERFLSSRRRPSRPSKR